MPIPKRTPSLAFAALFVSAPLSTGCLGDVDSVRGQQCQAICDKFFVCDDNNDSDRCKRACEAQGYWSEAYWEHRERCVVDVLTCNRLPSSFDALVEDEDVNECIHAALRRAPLSEEQERLCASTATKLESCDSDLDANLLDGYCTRGPVRQLSTEYLLDSADCINLQSCSGIQQCLDFVAEDYYAPVSLYDVRLKVE